MAEGKLSSLEHVLGMVTKVAGTGSELAKTFSDTTHHVVKQHGKNILIIIAIIAAFCICIYVLLSICSSIGGYIFLSKPNNSDNS